MLHLFGFTILKDKSHVYIDMRYISPIIDLGFHRWAWRCIVVTIIYHALGKDTTSETRHIGGYMSLF